MLDPKELFTPFRDFATQTGYANWKVAVKSMRTGQVLQTHSLVRLTQSRIGLGIFHRGVSSEGLSMYVTSDGDLYVGLPDKIAEVAESKRQSKTELSGLDMSSVITDDIEH